MKTKFRLFFLASIFALNLVAAPWDGVTKTAWNSVVGVNDGTSIDKPFLIDTPEQLAKLAELVNTGQSYAGQYFKLNANLDLGNFNWTCIGNTNSFSGNFDGNWHTISNLSITKWSQNIGLFGYVNSATIKNLGIESGTITCGGSNAGAVVGQSIGTASALTVISNCYNKANLIYGASDPRVYLGGIVGLMLNNSWVDHCYNQGNITNNGSVSSNQTGGIVGAIATNSTVFSCYSSGIIIGNNNKGGIVGSNWSACSFAYYDADVCVGTGAATQAMGNTANTANVTGMTTANMKAAAFVTTLNGVGNSWVANTGNYPILSNADTTTDVKTFERDKVKIYAHNNSIMIERAIIGTNYIVSDFTGRTIVRGVVNDFYVQIPLSYSNVYIIIIGDKATKICI